MSPGGQTEGVAVCIVDGDLMGAEGGVGDEDARGDVVDGGEAEGVQGAEVEYGAGLAVAAGLARPVERCARLVEDAEEGELGEDGDADDFRGGGGGGAGVLRDVGRDEGGPARAGVNEGELLLVGVYDAAGAARGLTAVSGHGCHVREGGGDEAAVVAVREVGGGEGCRVAGDGEGEGDGSVGAHGPGDDQAGGLVVELGEPVALVAPLLGTEGVGEPFAGGHADDQAAVEAVCPGAKVPRGAEAQAEAGVVLAQYPEVRVRLVSVADGAGAVGGEGCVGGGAGYKGEAEGGVAWAVGEGGGGVGGGEREIGG